MVSTTKSEKTMGYTFDNNNKKATISYGDDRVTIGRKSHGFSYKINDGPEITVGMNNSKDFVEKVNKILDQNIAPKEGRKDFSKEIGEIYNKMFSNENMKKIPIKK